MESYFYEMLNSGMKYFCDRCKVATLREDEWDKNRNVRGVYCDECWSWIHLQKWTDKDGNHHTTRSERIVLNKIN